jgi:site-specific DNA recombinase
VVRLAATGMKLPAIAEAIQERPSLGMIKKALALHQEMEVRQLESPYVVVFDPPEDYPKVRRHRQPRYKFVPLVGYERPQL